MDYEEFRHEAVHALMSLNEQCKADFGMGEWERWDYELEKGTLIFSEGGRAKVVAQIEVVGSVSNQSGTWKWGWAMDSLPKLVTSRIGEVRKLGEERGLEQLTTELFKDYEGLGWQLTGISTQVLGGIGAYRCPSDKGFLYLVLMSAEKVDFEYIRQEEEEEQEAEERYEITCGTHGESWGTFICVHLAAEPGQVWYSNERSEENPWPDSWCEDCEAKWAEDGEIGSDRLCMLCHHCYDAKREKEVFRD